MRDTIHEIQDTVFFTIYTTYYILIKMEKYMKENILVINPGSTSTKIAIFNQEGKEIF